MVARRLNAAAGSFFGGLKHDRVNRRQDLNCADARADEFDYLTGFHNSRK